MDKKQILELIEDVDTVFSTAVDAIDTNNGILNRQYLESRKRKLFYDATAHLIYNLVEVEQGYPENNISDVKLTADFVVIKREDFELIKQYIEEHE